MWYLPRQTTPPNILARNCVKRTSNTGPFCMVTTFYITLKVRYLPRQTTPPDILARNCVKRTSNTGPFCMVTTFSSGTSCSPALISSSVRCTCIKQVYHFLNTPDQNALFCNTSFLITHIIGTSINKFQNLSDECTIDHFRDIPIDSQTMDITYIAFVFHYDVTIKGTCSR